MKKRPTKGILLVQLGTPDSPEPQDVHRYLTEFLMDGRVIDIPVLGRNLLVRGAIVPTRAWHSSQTYKTIWDVQYGSPLMYYSLQQQKLLQTELGDEYHVELAMRYQNPSIDRALKNMEAMLLDSICVIPLFPQYASATTGSVIERVMRNMKDWQYFPNISFVNGFCDDDLMIEAIVDHANQFDLSDYDHILFSYHGLPERQLKKIDPLGQIHSREEDCEDCREVKNSYCYLSQCYATTRSIVSKLGLSKEQYSVCFQSRLGKTPWIQPYTSDSLHELAVQGKKKILVFSPAFVADCIETLDEIKVEYAQEFKNMGGEVVDLVESLNTHPKWIESLKRMSLNNT